MSAEVEAALRALEELARRGGRASHRLARDVLLALGWALRERAEACTAWIERARAAGRAAGPGWAAAVQSELTLASGEFAQCLDPRYLDLPDYDLEYTRAARARLEDRLRSARELGFDLTERERELLALADRVLAALEEKRAAPGGQRKLPPGTRVDPPGGADRSSGNGRRK